MAKHKKLSRSRRAAYSGVDKLMSEYKSTGKISTSRATYHPKSTKAAQEQAAAIEYGKHGIGRAGRKKKKR